MRIFAALALAALAIPGMALAHAHAAKTDPAKGAAVKSPAAVHVSFSEAVKPAFTGGEIDGPDGKAVRTGKPAFDAARMEMTLPVDGALKPGAYTVKWHAVAADTHRSQGAFGFTVTP